MKKILILGIITGSLLTQVSGQVKPIMRSDWRLTSEWLQSSGLGTSLTRHCTYTSFDRNGQPTNAKITYRHYGYAPAYGKLPSPCALTA